MNFNNVFLPKSEPSDLTYRGDAAVEGPISNSENNHADFSSIDNQLDHLFAKVVKIEVDMKEVEDFYSDVVKKQLQNDSKEGVILKGRNSLTSVSTKKNQTRAVAARRSLELKMGQDKGTVNLEAEARTKIQLAQEVAHAKTARKISSELHDIDRQLGELRETVLQKCRKFSVDEKRRLSAAFTKLSPEHLIKALEIVAQSNPNFSGLRDEVDLDMDNLSESTLWRLKIFVKEALKVQGNGATANAGNGNGNGEAEDKNTINKKRKKISAVLAKRKRTKVEVMNM